MNLWHSLDIEEVIGRLDSSEDGLSEEEAQKRLEQFGPNELRKEEGPSPWSIFFEQFKDFLILLLLAATFVSLLIGEVFDAAAIMAIVVMSAFLGFLQEYRAERALEALKKMAAPEALVLRGGRERRIPARELVPGDIVLVHPGDRVPADARLIEQFNLKVDEAPLTGESVPVNKEVAVLPPETALADRKNMLYAGTTVTYGRGKAAVVATGMETEFGRIAQMIQMVEEEETPLERRMAEVGKWLGIGSLAVVAVVSLLGIFRGHALLEMFLWGVSLAVAAVPEALPAVVTGALAIGVQRMARRNAIVRRLPAVETLGCTTFICSDKTGTLTKNEMTVRRIWLDGEAIEVTGVGFEPKGEFICGTNPLEGNKSLNLLLKTALLCNDAHLGRKSEAWSIIGDPTEGALVVAAAKVGLDKRELDGLYPRIAEVPFTSERKRMSTVHATPEGTKIVCTKGAPEIVLARCSRIYRDGRIVELGEADREEILRANEGMAADALRVLGIAYKELPPEASDFSEDVVEKDLLFLGLMAMIDPPRDEVRDALCLCEGAGVEVAMVTGDHKLTALAIAEELGMLKEGGLTLTGVKLDRLNDEEFEGIVEKVGIYARVSPEHKMRIVEALKKRGHIVAMTGDGVNDAPALKRADMGVAMGITGTEVTKEASDMVLADDNFATIVAAIEEGRAIYDNVKKYLSYLLSCNVGEILIMFVASLMGLPLPLTAIQILWVNLVTDGLPAIALGVDPPEPDIMFRPPRDPKESVFTTPVKLLIIVVSILMTAGVVPVFASVLPREGLVKAQTMAFTMMTMFEMFNAFNCRSERYSIFEVGPFANPWLVLAVLSSILLQAAVIYLPFLQPIFGTATLGLADWLVVTAIASSALIVVEIGKRLASHPKAQRVPLAPRL
ncbi:MAG: calcium-transporting P-type ATPase, PMR1-type [Anaerolineae bacterium]